MDRDQSGTASLFWRENGHHIHIIHSKALAPNLKCPLRRVTDGIGRNKNLITLFLIFSCLHEACHSTS